MDGGIRQTFSNREEAQPDAPAAARLQVGTQLVPLVPSSPCTLVPLAVPSQRALRLSYVYAMEYERKTVEPRKNERRYADMKP